MGYNQDVCGECAKRCLLIHGNRDHSPTVTSFFKVLVGNRFSEVLFIPPKFASTLSSMLGRKSYLEDSNGRRWRVKLATIDGSLAFRKGWAEFASDHILEAGQFLDFTYIIGSHFVVKIFDRSGCEKLNFSQKVNIGSRKKANPELSPHLPSDGRNSVPTEAFSLMIDRGSMKEHGGSNSTVPSAPNTGTIDGDVEDAEKTVRAAKNTSVRDICQERPKSEPMTDCTEVPYYIIDRDVTTGQEETRNFLFDLSNFEILRDQSRADRTENLSVAVGEETSSHNDGNLVRPQASVGEGTVDKNHRAVEEPCGPASLDVSDLEMTQMDFSAKDIYKVPQNIEKDSCCHHNSLQTQIPSARQPNEKKKENPDVSNIVFGQYRVAARQNFNDLGKRSKTIIEQFEEKDAGQALKDRRRLASNRNDSHKPQIITKVSGNFVPPVVLEGKKGKGLKVVKKEHEEMIKEPNGKKSKTIKEEFEEKVNLSSQDKGIAYKAVKAEPADPDDFLSPDLVDFCYSVTAVTQSWLELPTASVSCKRKSKMDRQIVLLRDPAMKVWAVLYHETPGFRVLTSGWEAFAKANNIQPGDVCIFGVESQSESLLRVNIVRR